MKKQIPNLITALRIIIASAIIFIEPLSIPFYALYSACGISDVLDGFLARKLHAQSNFGAILDSAADLIFIAAVVIKLWDLLYMTVEQYTFVIPIVIAILTVKTVSYVIGAIKFRRFTPLHTVLNKATGVLLFALPYFIGSSFYEAIFVPLILVCIFAGAAALEDVTILITSKTYNPNIKTIFSRKDIEK